MEVNDDLASYLPAETETRRGLTVMEDEFVTFGTNRVLVDNISYARAEALAEELEGLEGVKSVEFDGTAGHYTNGSALFSVTYDGSAGDPVSLEALERVRETLSGLGAMCFMRFGIGKDLGLILMKAIVLSLLAVKTRYIMPPIFVVLLIGGFIFSNRCPYVYGQTTLTTLRQNESQIAQQKVDGTFGGTNTIAVMVPGGDYERGAAFSGTWRPCRRPAACWAWPISRPWTAMSSPTG